MKIQLSFRGDPLGTAEWKDGRIEVGGNKAAVNRLLDHYRRDGYDGLALLAHLTYRLNGQMRAERIDGASREPEPNPEPRPAAGRTAAAE